MWLYSPEYNSGLSNLHESARPDHWHLIKPIKLVHINSAMSQKVPHTKMFFLLAHTLRACDETTNSTPGWCDTHTHWHSPVLSVQPHKERAWERGREVQIHSLKLIVIPNGMETWPWSFVTHRAALTVFFYFLPRVIPQYKFSITCCDRIGSIDQPRRWGCHLARHYSARELHCHPPDWSGLWWTGLCCTGGAASGSHGAATVNRSWEGFLMQLGWRLFTAALCSGSLTFKRSQEIVETGEKSPGPRKHQRNDRWGNRVHS